MAVQKKSLENLTNIADNVTAEECKQNGKKGGIASGKARRDKKEMRELVQEILNMNVRSGKAEDFQNLAESKGKNITVNQALVLAQVKKAMSGDTRAVEFLRDTAGQKPTDKQEIRTEITGTGKLDAILKAINDDNE